MPKGYLLFEVDVTDPEVYIAEYGAAAFPILKKYGARVLINKGRQETIEGGWAPPSIVVVEFDTYDQARAFYYSEEYQKAAQIRHTASTGRAVLVEGI